MKARLQHGVVAITTGLRDKLKRDELQGVIAHEMAHIRNFDIRYAMLMATLVGVVVLLCDMFLRSMWYGGGRRRRSSRSGGQGSGAAMLILTLAACAGSTNNNKVRVKCPACGYEFDAPVE